MWRGQRLIDQLYRASGANDAPSKITVVTCHHDNSIDWIPTILHAVHKVVLYDTKQKQLPEWAQRTSNIEIVDKSSFPRHGFPALVFHYCAFQETDADYVLFLHGHNTDWHQKLPVKKIVSMCVDILRVAKIEFIKVSDRFYEDWQVCRSKNRCMLTCVTNSWSTLARILNQQDTPPPLRIVDINTEQALVHKSRITRHSALTWKMLYEHALSVEFHSEHEWALEGAFHYLMGEPWQRSFIMDHKKEIASGKNELELRFASLGLTQDA